MTTNNIKYEQKIADNKLKAVRLKQVCEYLIEQSFAKNYAELSKIFGYSSRGVLWRILNMSDTVPKNILNKIAVYYPQINVKWIAMGEGDMLLTDESKPKSSCIDRFVKYLYAENILIGEALKKLGWQRRTYDNALRSDLTRAQIREIERTFENLNMEWLVYGTGNMVRVAPENVFTVLQRMQREIDALRAKVGRLERMQGNSNRG